MGFRTLGQNFGSLIDVSFIHNPPKPSPISAVSTSIDYVPLINSSISLKSLASISDPHELECRRLEASQIPRLYFLTEIHLEHFLRWRCGNLVPNEYLQLLTNQRVDFTLPNVDEIKFILWARSCRMSDSLHKNNFLKVTGPNKAPDKLSSWIPAKQLSIEGIYPASRSSLRSKNLVFWYLTFVFAIRGTAQSSLCVTDAQA